jgi:hypothetical protein
MTSSTALKQKEEKLTVAAVSDIRLQGIALYRPTLAPPAPCEQDQDESDFIYVHRPRVTSTRETAKAETTIFFHSVFFY